MAQSAEQYMASQEMPEQCPICDGEWCAEDGTSLVPESQVPFCSSECKATWDKMQEVNERLLAEYLQEQAALPSREEIRRMTREGR
jgi:hypothetical protein